LQPLLGLLVSLLKHILDFLDAIFQMGDALSEPLVLPGDLASLFFLGQSVVGPSLLIISFEGDPFLAETLFSQALDFGHLIDPAVYFNAQFFQGLLRSLNRPVCFIQGLEIRIDI